MKGHRCVFPGLALAACLLVVGCRRSPRPVSATWSEMGTFCTVSMPASDAAALGGARDTCTETIAEFNRLLTVYRPDSEISRLNKAAGKEPVAIAPDTRRVLELCLQYADLTEGAFDPTVGALVRLWGFNDGTVPGQPLGDSVIQEAMQGIGFRRIQLGPEGAFLDDSRAGVDLGGIAKGYAVDACFDRLQTNGVGAGMVNIGGNLRCWGEARPGRAWMVGVRNPFDRDEVIGTLSLTGGDAVATSGNYERFVTIAGKRYAHIIDPRTGQPVKGMAGVTVTSELAVEADALSTALFVMGVEEGAKLAASLPGSAALLVPDRRPLEIHMTPGFAARFSPSDRFASAVRLCPTQ